MSRSIRTPDYRQPEPPAYRIEWCGGLQVHVPIKPNDTYRKFNEGVAAA